MGLGYFVFVIAAGGMNWGEVYLGFAGGFLIGGMRDLGRKGNFYR